MNFKNALNFFKKSQPLIRHCWVYNIYKKKLLKRSFKEKFINFLTKDGKKSKGYKLFSKTALLVRKKLLNTEKDYYFFEDQQKAVEKIISFHTRVKKISKKSNFSTITTISKKKKYL